jgi:hypothetical protein
LFGRLSGPALLVAAVAVLCAVGPGQASAAPTATRLSYAPGEIVPIPAAVPHEEGDMVDRRIVANLRWMAQRFPLYITDGYSGKLPNGEHVGCRGCHVKHSDHYNGLAVDISPLYWSPRCDRRWRGITRLARWAEPRQNRPRAPFRWVGYEGDSGHGCGHHLHLSWEHAPARSFQLAEWVEVFSVDFQGVTPRPIPDRPRPETHPTEPPPAEASPPPPSGGVSSLRAGGVSAPGD